MFSNDLSPKENVCYNEVNENLAVQEIGHHKKCSKHGKSINKTNCGEG